MILRTENKLKYFIHKPLGCILIATSWSPQKIMAHFRTYDYKNEHKEGIIYLEIKLELKEETTPIEDVIIAVNLTELEKSETKCVFLIDHLSCSRDVRQVTF